MQRPYENHLLSGYNTSDNYVIAAENSIAVFINQSAAEIIGINMIGEPICDVIGEEIGALAAEVRIGESFSLTECDFYGRRCMLNIFPGSPVLYIFCPEKDKEPESDMIFPAVSLLGLSAELRRLISPIVFSGTGVSPAVMKSGYQLVRLINNLADYIRYNMETEAVICENTDIVALCDKVVSSVRPILQIKNIPIHFECPQPSCSFAADPQMIRRMLLNLINNSAKYTQDGNQILIRLNVIRNQCYIIVSDRGAGLGEEYVANAFQSFHSYDFPRLIGGYGLGLALVRTIALLHGGSVVLETKPGVGTTVTTSLPIKKIRCQTGLGAPLGDGFDPPLLELSDVLNTDEFSAACSLLKEGIENGPTS